MTRSALLAVALTCVASLLGAPAAGAAGLDAVPDRLAWTLPDEAREIAAGSTATFVGGDFFAARQRSAGFVRAGFGVSGPQAPRRDVGDVERFASDGDGGWYAYGARASGDFHATIKHIRADGSLDRAFAPVLDGFVEDMVLSPDRQTLYVSGNFDRVNGAERPGLAALDARTGAATAWRPAQHFIATRALALSRDGRVLYRGGDWVRDTPSGAPLTGLSTATGAVVWNPRFKDRAVTSLALSPGGETLYTGRAPGESGDWHGGVTAVGTGPTAPVRWQARLGDYGSVSTVELTPDGSRLYAGGHFALIRGERRNNVAQLVASSGALTPWNVRLRALDEIVGASVASIALAPDRGEVYLAGSFRAPSGNVNLAAVSAADGTARTWWPSASYVVRQIELTDDGRGVQIGGLFETLRSVGRDGLVKLDRTGVPTAWRPRPAPYGDAYPRPVTTALAISPDEKTVFVGTRHDKYDGSGRREHRLDAYDAISGERRWGVPVDHQVGALAVAPDGETLYAGGAFAAVALVPRRRLAALRAGDGTLLPWNPGSTGGVSALLPAPDGRTVYAGGAFVRNPYNREAPVIGGAPRSRIAELDAVTGLATAWDPGAPEQVAALAFAPGGAVLYAGGKFDGRPWRDGKASRGNVVALSRTASAQLPWASRVEGPVAGLAPDPLGGSLYIAGALRIAGQDRGGLGAVRMADGGLDPWAPAVQDGYRPYSLFHAVAFDPAGAGLHVAGQQEAFAVGDWIERHHGYARFDRTAG